MRSARLGALLLVLAGCHRGAAGPAAPERPGSLADQTLPLLPSPHLRLVVEGHLNGRPVPVVLDVSRALSAVSEGCWDEKMPPPPIMGNARVPDVYAGPGGLRDWPLVRVPGLRVGSVPLGPRGMGLTGERTCSVTLGADVLSAYAFTVDPLRREVTFEKSRPRAEYLAQAAAPGADPAEEVYRLELTRDPVGDWPLIAARVTQEEAALTGPYVLSTREPFSRLAMGAAEAQGIQPLETAANLPPRAYVVDAVELSSDVGVKPLVMEAGVGWRNPTTLGRIGPDVWGHFRTTVDVQGDTLVLRRPRVQVVEDRQRCARSGAPNAEELREESCFGLHVRRGAEGRTAVTGAVFRDLPEGGRVHLEPLGEDGKPLPLDCKVGFSFAPTSRGATTQHLVPWPRLAQSMPECSEALKSVRGYTLALFEEGQLQECPNACIFVHQPSTGRTVCECQPTPLGDTMAVPRRSNTPKPPTQKEREQEPEDPH
ncbi:hypothetical protein JRI60_40095 [Archangium violaceum]|uniref:hypothetical protein n=1 Tax=Archangium violaceum TaxID=83451 RepID=UPI00194DC0CA|nr:hypothetical protein [Archangium violaceum]QRN95223.1 hypothetical protein JRI60_40095 [Archangium violaceum]